jgi:ABC-type multidrug transport system ATPase subunit
VAHPVSRPAAIPVQDSDPVRDPILQVESLSKRFGPRWALRDASFSIGHGEVLGLIGPNGSGKTTLFQCLAGVLPATSGTVRAAHGTLSADERKHALFFMPDGVRPWPEQRLHWLLEFVGALAGARTAECDLLARALGLAPLLDARLRTLSKGEHKRALLACGLLTRQPVLLLDEPFDGLDLRQTREAMAALRQHVARGRTLFLSIHQLVDAARICDRLVLLSGGRIMGEGTLEELGERAGLGGASPSLEEIFLALT